MDSVNSRSLLECKLRRCVYLGTCYSIYIPPEDRNQYWKKASHIHRFDFNIIKTIGKAVRSNNINTINSIVPILEKINKENPLDGDKNLIFALAVCAKFSVNQCKQMVEDSYAAVDKFCTDGTKLLMFVEYCSHAAKMLYQQGYLPFEGSGLRGSGFKNTIRRWYLKRDPFDTVQLILQSRRFGTMTHKRVMNIVKLNSDDPVQRLMIIYTTQTMDQVKEYYLKMKRASKRYNNIDNNDKMFAFLSIQEIYNYLHQYYDSININSETKINAFKYYVLRNLIGTQHDVLPPEMQYDMNFLPSYVEHMPLKQLLSKTCNMAKKGLFHNVKGTIDCLSFVNRFKHRSALKKSDIHPIESYVTYLKYANTGEAIANIRKPKESPLHWNTVDLDKRFMNNPKENNILELDRPDNYNNNNDIINDKSIYFMKPKPKYSPMLRELLTKDLVTKTLNNLESPNHPMLIAYDGRQYLKSFFCKYPHVKVVPVVDAIALTVLSLIYPLKERGIQPMVLQLNDSKNRFKRKMIDFNKDLSVESMKKNLFSKPLLKINEPDVLDSRGNNKPVHPLATMTWARKRKLRFDLFVFLGTHNMDFNFIKKVKDEYSKFLGKRVKIIICCLNGPHKEQINLSRDGMLFIPGFHKHTGQIIQSFINDKF